MSEHFCHELVRHFVKSFDIFLDILTQFSHCEMKSVIEQQEIELRSRRIKCLHKRGRCLVVWEQELLDKHPILANGDRF